MNFLAPGFAIFAVLFGVPIVIHLIGRSRAKIQRFAPIELLMRSERKVARRSKLRQILLLTLRALAIAAVPLILAKPFVEADSDLPGAVGGTQSAVIVLDDSMSMSLRLDGEPLLERARTRAKRIVTALGGEADAALVLASRGATVAAPVPELTADRARLERAIAEVEPSYRGTDLTGALKRAAQILESAAGGPDRARRVYLVTDFQAVGVDRDPPWAAGSGPELVPVDVADGKPLDNRAVTDVRTEPAPHLGPRGVRVSVDIANYSDSPAKEVAVTLRVDGKAVAKGLVDLAAQSKVTKRFLHAFAPRDSEAAPDNAARAETAEVGVHEVVAELQADGLPADDRRFARVELRRDLRVLIVDGDARTVRREDEVFYLETALRPGDRGDSQLEVTTVTPDELRRRRLQDFDVVWLCNVKAPLDAPALRDYLGHGGGLFITLGENVDPDAYNQSLGDLLPQPLQAIRSVAATAGTLKDGETRVTGEGARLGRIDRNHPVLAPLSKSAGKDDEPFKEARFSRYALFKPSSNDGDRQVLLRFEDGAPALIESREGAGRVMLLASTVDRDWNDLAIQPIFLPLVQQATRYLARASMHEPEPPALVGQRHDIPLGDADQRVEVTLPSGKTRWFDRDKVAGRRVLGFSETDEPGVYRVAVAAGDRETVRPRPQATFVVNLDAAESDVSRLSAARIAQLATGAGAKSTAAPRRRVELWHALGAALLLLLLGETLLLRRK